MRTRAALVMVGCVVLAILATSCTPPSSGGGSGTDGIRTWNPAVTDPAITSDPIDLSFSKVPVGTPRGQLAVLLAGTGAGPLAHTKLAQRLSGEGFHVIGLRYPSSVGTYDACPASIEATFPDCHRALRGELAFGENVAGPAGPQDHPSLSVDAANSVTNRLIKHLDRLRALYPTKGGTSSSRPAAAPAPSSTPPTAAARSTGRPWC